MSQHIVRDIIETRLRAWAAARSPALPLAWQNVPFTPPTGYYAACSMLPAPTDDRTLERTQRYFSGVYQVLIFSAVAKGVATSEFLLSTLDAAFQASPLSGSGLKVELTRPWTARSGFPEGSRWCVPLDCAYAATAYV